ncbi:DNA polymerase II large subunit, partial [Candidatus Bathyarchaeota archaeon]
MIASKKYERYFRKLETELERIYRVASEARSRGLDPYARPEPKLSKDLAERVEFLVGPKGVADHIREFSLKMSREEVALKIAEEVVYGVFGRLTGEKAAEQALRTALAIVTEGVTVAPVQGITRVAIKTNDDGSRYLAVYFAGPIRPAGGTEQAFIVVV